MTMDKQAAENRITNTFNYPFDEQRFRTLTRDLFDDHFEEFKDSSWITGYIKKSFREHIKKYKRIGKYSYHDGSVLDVIIVHLKKEAAIDRARTMQRNFIASYLETRGGKEAAIVAFYTDNPDDWRFSYVRVEYKEAIDSEKVKVKKVITAARRHSFLVGKNEPNHTAKQQLMPLLQNDSSSPTFSELEDAFSVEAVTKQFYLDYEGLFEKLKKELDHILKKDSKIKQEFETKSIDTANFAKKLLGQIVFLYFLQKKGWLGVPKDERWGQGDKRFLGTLLKRCIAENKNFFNDYLEYLFYEALATTEGRATIDLSYYPKFDCKIPFLNGGLFEATYDWKNTNVLLPDELFSNNESTKAGDTGTGILDIFDRYNFTVKEDEPLEKEVAVDPEMLGKVFENLLPENLRKGQGAYYTPREIVHYMCQQSLINYLATEVSACHSRLTPCHSRGSGNPVPTKDDIENFIHKGEFAIEHDTAKEEGTKSYKYQVDESIRKNAQLLDAKLETIKICDPAIGSGAFPVGMMHEIVKARNVLETYLKTGKNAYEFKRHCIQESLYGVDIDPGAIEIAKLRLWLSLVVDEEDYLDIKPLPNLDYKIMQGNSLLEDFHEVSLNLEKNDELLFSENEELDLLIEDLHRKQSEFFSAIHHSDKNRLREEVEDAIVKVFHYELKRRQEQYFKALDRINKMASGFPKEEDRKKCYDAEKAKLDKRYKFDFESVENELREMTHGNKIRNFFPWKLYFANVFKNNNGFDVMIANPPYIRHEGIRSLKPFLAKEFQKFYCSTADIYTYFYKRGLELLKRKGCLCFIAPNKFMRATYGKNTRHVLTNTGTPRFIIDFCDLPIFDATTYPAILLIEKNKPGGNEKTLVTTFRKSEQLELIEDTISSLGFQMPVTALKPEGWTLEKPQVLALMEKIRGAGKPLGKYVNGRFYYGIKTGLNEAFVIDADTRERLIAKDPASEDLIRPWLRGRDIRKWKIEWAELYVINIPSTVNKKWPWSDAKAEDTARQIFEQTYPSIYRHLSRWEKKLKKRDDQGRFWWELRSCAYYGEFGQSKITWGNLATEPKFAFDTTSSYVSAPANIIPTEDLYLLAIINSPLCKWMIALEAATRSGGFLEYKPMYVGKIPIFSASDKQKAPIVKRIRTILENPDEPDILNLEAEINTLIYDLYDLTVEEIAIVEENKY